VALYDITIKDERTGDLVAKSQDLVYRKKEWFVPQ
jgi:acyl-CoA thioesterase